MPEETIKVTWADMDDAWNKGGTRRIGKVQVVDRVHTSLFRAYDFVVINTSGVYRLEWSNITGDITLLRKEERLEAVSRWVPVVEHQVTPDIMKHSELKTESVLQVIEQNETLESD